MFWAGDSRLLTPSASLLVPPVSVNDRVLPVAKTVLPFSCTVPVPVEKLPEDADMSRLVTERAAIVVAPDTDSDPDTAQLVPYMEANDLSHKMDRMSNT